MTSEYEILRGDMARLIYEATTSLPNVTYIFDETLTSITPLPTAKLSVSFANRLPASEFDLVVGADGMMSRTRRLVFGHGPNDADYLYRLGQYSAYFTIPRAPSDTKFAQWWNAPKGRLLFLRPDQYGTTRAYVAVTDANLARFDDIDGLIRKGSREQQQAWFEREFAGVGWQAERVMREMKTCEDWYVQQIAQVRMESWVKGRVVLLGDAGWAPSPISGVVSYFVLINTPPLFLLPLALTS